MASTVHKLFMRSSPLLKPLMDTRTCDPIIWLTSSFHIELDGRVVKKTAYRLTISRPYNSANGQIVIVKTHLSRFIIIIKERAHSLDKHWFYFTLLKFCGQESKFKSCLLSIRNGWGENVVECDIYTVMAFRGAYGSRPPGREGSQPVWTPPPRHGNHNLSRVGVFREQLGHSPWGITFSPRPNPPATVEQLYKERINQWI